MGKADLISQTLEILADKHGDPALQIYDWLFGRHPDYQALFVLDTDGGVRGSMLETCITALLGIAEGDRTQRFILDAARSDHQAYGVLPEHFNDMFEAIRYVTREACAAAWTDDRAAAWTAVLDALEVNADGPVS